MDLMRAGLDIGVGRWKALLIAFCLFSATVMGIEGAAAVATFTRGSTGALGLAFLWGSLTLGTDHTTAGGLSVALSLVFWLALAPGWYCGLWFATHYPDEQPQGWRRGLRRVLPLFLAGLVLVEIATLGLALERVPPAWFNWTQVPYIGAAGLLMLVAFWDGWRRSTGERRQRFSWLLGAFALMWAVSYATWLGDLAASVDLIDAEGRRWLSRIAVVGSLMALFGLTYAILRHRVLDMGLALNRSLVFAVIGAILLGSFHFLNVLAGRLLHFDDPAKAGLLSAVLAGFVGLAYPKVKPRAEWLVDRLFFGPWVAREADLARFAADARGYTEAAALATALVAAVDRFGTGAGAALYVRQVDGCYALQPGASLAAPPVVPADEPMAVALRAGRSVASRDDVHSSLPGELAVVLSRQRELEAFVLIGRQRDGRVLRSDEVVALRDALQAAGAEWQALRWAALRRSAAPTHAASA